MSFAPFYNNDDFVDSDNLSLNYGSGRGRCRIVCDQNDRYPRDLRTIARIIINRSLPAAQQIYQNIRVVIRDGQRLVVTQDFRRDRINVETRNGIVIRVLGFY